MENRFHILLIMASAGMMLCWFYAWNSFIMFYLSSNPIPMLPAAFVLAFSSIITFIHRNRGWRWISILLAHLCGFLFSLCLLVYLCNDFFGSFWSQSWVREFIYQKKDLIEWIVVCHMVFWAIFLWIFGIKLIYRIIDTRLIQTRVDIGLTGFLLLLLIKVLIDYKGGPIIYDHSITLTFLAFIIFALFSMGLVRNRQTTQSGEIQYYSNIGAILSFIFFVVLFGGGIVMLFFPGLISGAEFSYELIKTVSRPVGNILVYMLRFIFMKGCKRVENNASQSWGGDDGSLLSPVNGEIGIIEYILFGFLTAVIIIATAVLIVVLTPSFARWIILKIRTLIKLLLSRTPKKNTGNSPLDLMIRALYILREMVLLIIEKIMTIIKTRPGSEYYYLGLLRWGYYSGMPRIPWETPREYGSRLIKRFPALKREIDRIVEMYNLYLYGNVQPNNERLILVRKAWRRLRNPLFWPIRLKTRIITPASREWR